MNNKIIKTIDKRKSEEIYKKNSKRINDKDTKRDYNDKNCEQSDKAINDQASKRIFDSLMDIKSEKKMKLKIILCIN